mmetsp:Transcript_83693/g.175065  ORF Transcript_83693/g.175065 Transcript_83693/m.175065 type:complete len:417 (-) Transcript_83693:226-1476(-)
MAAVVASPVETQTQTKMQSTMQNEDYNNSSHNQLAAHRITYDALRSALQRLSKRSTSKDSEFLQICDLGSAGGANSVELMKVVLNELRGNCEEQRQVSITFEEQPESDFNSLVQTVMKEEASLWGPNSVKVNFVAKSFYLSLFPSHSVDLSLSYIALHWMSSPPSKAIKGSSSSSSSGDWIFCGEPGTPKEVFDAWREASMKDLVHFLRLRAEELRPGGEGLYLMAGGDTFQEWLYGPNPQDVLDLAKREDLPFPVPIEQQENRARPRDVKTSGRFVFTEAMMRSIKKGEVRQEVLEQAYAPVFLRTRADVLEALQIVNQDAPGGQLELMELRDERVAVGGKAAAGTFGKTGSLMELSWSIHANYLQATGGATMEEMESLKRSYAEVHAETFQDEEMGAAGGYMYLHVRRSRSGNC